MKWENNLRGFIQILIIVTIILPIIAFLLIYGTISPCEIMKKEVAQESNKRGEQVTYILFGGFIERGIDTLNPLQCIYAIYEIKTGNGKEALNKLFK